MDDWTRDLLTAVQEGRLAPDEAAEQLDSRAAERPPEGQPDQPSGRPGGSHAGQQLGPEVARVAVRVGSRQVRVIGDPAVATVSVEGPHEITREGDTLVITGSWDLMRGSGNDDGFVLTPFRRFMRVAGKMLAIRVNPALPVEIDVAAGSVTVERVPNLAVLRVVAGSARATGITEPFEVSVQAGSANIEACPTHGLSRVRCETGSVSVRLLHGSDVRIDAHAELGKVTLPKPTGAHRQNKVSGTDLRASQVIGAGTGGVLDIDVTLGGVDVRSDA